MDAAKLQLELIALGNWEFVVDRARELDSSWNVKRLSAFSGETAFLLYDTYGFPLDLTELMARERGLTVDVEGFNKLMEEQKARARAAQKKTVIELSQIETQTPTTFVGYDKLETRAKVLEVVGLKDKTAIILDTSACYAEMGGQVGDTGELLPHPVAADVSRLTSSGSVRADSRPLLRVVNTQKSANTWLHFVEGDNLPAIGDELVLRVEAPRRAAIQRHHTVTHLLHWALHEVVSPDVSQKGSFVGADKLTFDFNHAPLTPQQVADVEKLVNERIVENAPVSWLEVKYSHIKDRKDVMQFFGEKYGDWVRVVQIGGQPTALDGYSMELCGGTHCRATGEIGLFRIVAENAIAAGVRRIEAIAGLEAWRRAGEEVAMLKNVAERLATPIVDLDKKIENLLAQQKELEKQLRAMQQKEAAGAAKALLGKAATINGIPAVIERFDADGDTLQGMVNELKGQFKGVIVLGGAANNAVALIASVSPEFTAKVQAGKIIQQIAPVVGGKGGGRPDNARGGGKDVAKLDEALAKARSLLG
jgi:alanyl-tRNA synthetase